MKPSDLFSVLSGRILVDLSEQFPIPANLDREKYMKDYIDFDALRDVALKRSNIEFLSSIRKDIKTLNWSEEDYIKAERMAEDLRAQERTLEGDIGTMRAVWGGTLDFLESEGYVREIDGQGYQLTAKGLSHLSRPISVGGKDSRSILGWLKEAVEPKEVATAITNGTLMLALDKVFGG